MSQRMIIGLRTAADNGAELREALKSLGAEHVADPAESMPDVVVATLPPSADGEAFIKAAQKLAGVRYVERDAMRFSS